MESPHTPELWSATAAEYEEGVSRFTALYADDLLERLAPTGACETLEVAAGPGNVTVRLAPRCQRVFATDFAPGMIDRLRRRLAREGVDNVECAVMDGQALELEDASFSRVASNFGVMLFRDRVAGFSEMRRVLRPGGRVTVSGWSGPDRFEVFGVFAQAVRQAVPDLPEPDGPPPIFSLADPERFRAEMEAAGFTDVRVDRVERTLEEPSKEAFWQIMANSAPPTVALLERVGEENARAIRDALYELLDARFGGGPIALRAEATIGHGRAG